MPDELYQTKFGNLTENKPFGINVYKGMVSEFENKYRMQQKKAWQLDHCKRYLGTFKSPGHFSKNNALQEYNHATDCFETQYPAMFFVDPRTGEVWMVCLKMVLQLAVSWQVHPSRAGPALPDENPEPLSDWHMLADNYQPADSTQSESPTRRPTAHGIVVSIKLPKYLTEVRELQAEKGSATAELLDEEAHFQDELVRTYIRMC